jgi:hypothetical protein
MEDILLEVNRHGFFEETHFTIAYSPVPDDTAPRGIGGVLATVHEITEKIIGERRLAALRDLGARTGEAGTAKEACSVAIRALKNYNKDVPFELIYLLDENGDKAQLAATSGFGDGEQLPPAEVVVSEGDKSVWSFAVVLQSKAPAVVENLSSLMT